MIGPIKRELDQATFDQFLTISEVKKQLGYRSKNSVEWLITKKKLPFITFKGTRLFYQKDVDNI